LNCPFHHNTQNQKSKINRVQQNTLDYFILLLWQLAELLHNILIVCSWITEWYWSQLLFLASYSVPYEQEVIAKEGHSEI